MDLMEIERVAKEIDRSITDSFRTIQEQLNACRHITTGDWNSLLCGPEPKGWEDASNDDRLRIKMKVTRIQEGKFGSKMVARNSFVRGGAFTNQEFDDWWDSLADRSQAGPSQGNQGSDHSSGERSKYGHEVFLAMLSFLLGLFSCRLFMG